MAENVTEMNHGDGLIGKRIVKEGEREGERRGKARRGGGMREN